MPNITGSVVQPVVATGPKKAPPISGEVREFLGLNGEAAFSVLFKDGDILIKRAKDAVPDINRTIVPKYGNIRLIEGQMHQVADLALEYLFKIKEGT